MQPFHYHRPASLAEAIVVGGRHHARNPDTTAAFLAGGTTLIDLMKLNVMQPDLLVDLNPALREFSAIRFDGSLLRLGAFARMATAADHPDVRNHFPVVAQSLALAASAQLRNMATLGGNVLQRTRCAYFRDPSWTACNKRSPGSGCAAIGGANRQHAVLGSSTHCIATYHGDFAQALMALDAAVMLVGPDGARSMPFASLHLRPGNTPHIETNLRAGEIITEILVPAGPWTRRSRYVKVRDRQSYEFAVCSVAVALELEGNVVSDVRIALGGLATAPWRAFDAEQRLRGEVLNEATATEAARTAFADSVAQSHNAFKISVGQAAIVRALLETKTMEVRHG